MRRQPTRVRPLRLAIGVAIVLVTAATVVTGVAINTDEAAPDSMIVLSPSVMTGDLPSGLTSRSSGGANRVCSLRW